MRKQNIEGADGGWWKQTKMKSKHCVPLVVNISLLKLFICPRYKHKIIELWEILSKFQYRYIRHQGDVVFRFHFSLFSPTPPSAPSIFWFVTGLAWWTIYRGRWRGLVKTQVDLSALRWLNFAHSDCPRYKGAIHKGYLIFSQCIVILQKQIIKSFGSG